MNVKKILLVAMTMVIILTYRNNMKLILPNWPISNVCTGRYKLSNCSIQGTVILWVIQITKCVCITVNMYSALQNIKLLLFI